MPTERFVTAALAAGATSGNLLANSKFLYAPTQMAVTVYCIASVTGGLLSLTFGNVIEADRVNVGVETAAGAGPRVNEDRIAAGVAMGGDQLNCALFNPTAGAITFRTLIELRPL